MDKTIKKPELLAPAGDFERLKAAVMFGADAVYLAGTRFGMRTAPQNFSADELFRAVEFARSKNVRVYVTCNSVMHNDEIDGIEDFIALIEKAGADAVIISDFGVMRIAQKTAPNLDIHISTQAGIANYATANAFFEAGAQRVILARELTLDEISEIRSKAPSSLEIEAFVHGSMCVSFSGRCLLSSYLTNRDANRGDCSQPCRWKYALNEATRPGQYFPIFEQNSETHILNSRDMCMIEHIPALLSAGIESFKIEGRAKSAYYTAVVVNAYRRAIDAYFENPENFILPEWIKDEMNKVSHREYSTGFFFGNEPGQIYENGGYIRDYQVAAVVEDYYGGCLCLSQRNKFFAGDELDVLAPGIDPFLIKAEVIYNGNGEEIPSAPHAEMKLKIPFDRPLPKGTLLRKNTAKQGVL